ncbi:MAG: MOSC domain-containing protein [Bacteroidetes bacterium]|nr:MOSC domain-containing protein [Bacteroidota bacterium]MBL7103366.1 MOSC domain-containing protein [Bacteroidales bacterium]
MSENFKILSVNLSDNRGRKHAVEQIIINKEGIEGDVHAGTVRPVSLLGSDHIDLFRKLTGSREYKYGEFAENITVEGMGELKVKIFDRFISGDIELEVVKTGKPFHDKFREAGNCLMPKEGVLCRVFKNGTLKAGDTITHVQKIYKVNVITLSDRASHGVYEDKSGQRIAELTEAFFTKKSERFDIEHTIIPDDPQALEALLLKAREKKSDVVFTTGGTGIGPRDFTPEVVMALMEKEIPGIMEMIRLKYGMEKPNALLSRGVAGVMGETLIYALPGSVKAVNEYMTEILKTLMHLFYMLHGIDVH